MQHTVKLVVVALSAVGLSACAGYQLQDAKMMSAPSDPFGKALYSGYMEQAQLEYKEGDYADSDVFAMRAMAAANGQPTSPEALEARTLPGNSQGDLAAARGQLMTALDGGAAAKWPALAAQAQVMFECWMQEQEENFQPADIARCRTGFGNAMVQIRANMQPAAPAPMPAPAPTPAPMALPGPYDIYFDHNSARLTDAGAQIVARIAGDYAKARPGDVVLRGHTDTSGSRAYNDRLSRQRAEAVEKALVAAGVPQGELATVFFGEDQPKIKTEDGVSFLPNRRVEVVFQK